MNRFLLLFAALTLTACPPKEEDTGDGTGDTGETDETGDPVETGETGDTYDYTGISGTIVYQTTLGGAPDCDVEIGFTGTPYTGDCSDCSFAFDMDASVTRDDSVGTDCELSPFYSYMDAGIYYDMKLAYWDTYYYYGYYGDYTFYGVLGAGFSYNYYGYDYPGPYFGGTYFPGYSYGTVEFTGSALSWEIDIDTYTYAYYTPYGGECSTTTVFDDTTMATGDVTDTSTLPCDDYYAYDVWSFTSTTGSVAATIDTVADASAFDPAFTLIDSTGCFAGDADDSFECTYTPKKWSCPSGGAEGEPGTYYVLVHSWGSCNGTVGEYEIRVDGGDDLTLVADDVELSWDIVTTDMTLYYRLDGALE